MTVCHEHLEKSGKARGFDEDWKVATLYLMSLDASCIFGTLYLMSVFVVAGIQYSLHYGRSLWGFYPTTIC